VKIFCCIAICSLCFIAKGQVAVQPVAARYLNLAAYSRLHNDAFGGRANAASLASLKQGGIGVYGERRFFLDQLNLYNMAAALPTGSGTFGLSGSYFGFSQSNQTQASLSYGRKVAETVNVGASFHYHALSQAGIYGSSSAITGSLGIMMYLSDKIAAGINAFNPFRASWNKSNNEERLPTRYTFGMGYDASENFYMSVELEKEENIPLNVNLGMHYQVIPQFFVRGGIATQTSSYFAGLGLDLLHFRLDIATSFHPQLGLSPGVLIMYQFGKKKEE
jgi:hypothetical protein